MVSPWEPTLNTFILVAGLFTQLATLIFLAGKFTTRVDSLEKRVSDSEDTIESYHDNLSSVVALDSNMKILSSELLYIRRRLDSFIDKGVVS